MPWILDQSIEVGHDDEKADVLIEQDIFRAPRFRVVLLKYLMARGDTRHESLLALAQYLERVAAFLRAEHLRFAADGR